MKFSQVTSTLCKGAGFALPLSPRDDRARRGVALHLNERDARPPARRSDARH
jgi:hypothetical protein